MTDTATLEETDTDVDQSRKEAYFTAGQGQLIWTRFKKQRAAMIGGRGIDMANPVRVVRLFPDALRSNHQGPQCRLSKRCAKYPEILG